MPKSPLSCDAKEVLDYPARDGKHLAENRLDQHSINRRKLRFIEHYADRRLVIHIHVTFLTFAKAETKELCLFLRRADGELNGLDARVLPYALECSRSVWQAEQGDEEQMMLVSIVQVSESAQGVEERRGFIPSMVRLNRLDNCEIWSGNISEHRPTALVVARRGGTRKLRAVGGWFRDHDEQVVQGGTKIVEEFADYHTPSRRVDIEGKARDPFASVRVDFLEFWDGHQSMRVAVAPFGELRVQRLEVLARPIDLLPRTPERVLAAKDDVHGVNDD